MAVTLTSAALATAIKKPLEVAERLLPVASALVTRYGPLAPDAIQDEAVIRTAGHLAGQPATNCIREQSGIGDISQIFTFRPSLSALKGSGAAALLSPWVRRRGGLISGSGQGLRSS